MVPTNRLGMGSEPGSIQREQFGPRTAQRELNPLEGGHHDVQLPGLYLLNRPGVEIGKFGQALLSQFLLDTYAPYIATDGTDKLVVSGWTRHALLGRYTRAP